MTFPSHFMLPPSSCSFHPRLSYLTNCLVRVSFQLKHPWKPLLNRNPAWASISATMEDAWNSSYIFGIDNESDWGERYFFTYYSQFGLRSTTSVAFELALCSLVFVVSIVANVGIAVCIIRWVIPQTSRCEAY